ncbi:aldo/keto reductase [Lactiplantibacillus carotarum]|uniref:aldo/keto reductase n=1 Tax=Lactiplantibacillus carotarum TaxID=2993456 RepID=UPI00298EF633|nr:aldo/keto reductase [Lactiplantibacillus carotarum]
MKYVSLNNGVQMPMLGFGTYALARRVTKHFVEVALQQGYRLIDTAHYYGNETEVGQAIQASGIDRQDIFVTTKVDTSGYAATKQLLASTLPKFGGYADLVIIHWPQRDSLGTWRALEEVYQANQVRAIGVSNFNARETANLINNATIPPMLDQIETHLYWQQQKMHRQLMQQRIVHESYSP